MIIARIMQRIGESLFPIAFGIRIDKFESEKLAVAQGILLQCFLLGAVVRLATVGVL
jgi:hypothetical protein